MQSNARLQRALAIRQLGGTIELSCSEQGAPAGNAADLRLFAITFAAGFLFTTIFIA